MLEQLLHILVLSCVIYILTSGFTFFLRLRGTADFSYMAIVVFGAYAGAIIAEQGVHPVVALGCSFLLSIVFTVFILYIIKRLNVIYFNIGTFSLYVLMSYLATNLEITGASYGKSVTAFLSWGPHDFIQPYLIIAGVVIVSILFFYKTFFYQVLVGWGEHEHATQALGIRSSKYTLVLILITSFLAVLGGSMYVWYFSYISPSSFWIPFLVILMATTYGSYLFGEIGTFITTFALMYIYELMRFAKFVDPSRVGYLREMLFSTMVIIIVFIVFRRVRFTRER